MERLQGGAKDDLLKKNNSLLAFDFEAATRLKAWDSLEQLIKVSSPVSVVELNSSVTLTVGYAGLPA